MNPYYVSWQASTHRTAQCRDCHIPPGIVPYIETKLGSFREIYVHLSAAIRKAPLAVTREIPNASCFPVPRQPAGRPQRCRPSPSSTGDSLRASTASAAMCDWCTRTVTPP